MKNIFGIFLLIFLIIMLGILYYVYTTFYNCSVCPKEKVIVPKDCPKPPEQKIIYCPVHYQINTCNVACMKGEEDMKRKDEVNTARRFTSTNFVEGDKLSPGTYMTSTDGKIAFIFASDHNLYLFDMPNSKILWKSLTKRDEPGATYYF